MKYLSRILTLLLACLMLMQAVSPGFALQAEQEEVPAAVEAEPESLSAPQEELVQEEPALAEQPAPEAETAQSVPSEQEDSVPEEPAAEPDEADAQESEPEATVDEEAESEVTMMVETVTEQADLAQTEDAEPVTEERLYNGLEGDFDDPEFLKLLAQGFFDEEDEGPARALAKIQHPKIFNGYKITKGADISKWNNRTNWAKVKSNGIDFAIIRCGNRFVGDGHLGKDEMFDTNMKGALNAGLEVGVYIYSQAISVNEAIEEAKFALKLCKGYQFTLPIVMDYEYYAPGQGRLAKANLSQSKRTEICLAFCKTIRDAGYPAMVYANRDMLTKDMYGEQIIDAGYEIWLAEWNPTPKYQGTFTYWQYADDGYTPGFDHKVDMNFRYQLPDAAITRLSYSDEGVRLAWTKSAPAKGYRIYRKQEGANWALLETLEGSANVRWVDTSAVLDTRYSYSIQPYDGKISGTFDATGKSILYQKTVELVDLTREGTALQIEWKRNPDYDHYQIYRKRDENGTWTAIATVDGSANKYLDNSRFTSGRMWYYSVAGIRDGHRDGYDEMGIGFLYLTDPVLTGTTTEDTGITVKWKKTAGALSYNVYRKTEGGRWAKVGSTKELSWKDTKVSSNVIYFYTVRAVNNGTLSDYNTTGVKGLWLAVPKVSDVCSKSGGKQVEVTWSKVTGAEKYRVYRKTGEKGKWKLTATVTATSFTDTKVTKNGNYFYTVRAVSNKLGKTVLSGCQTGKGVVWLDMPQLVSAKPVLGSVVVKWRRVTGAKKYIVYRKKAGSGWKKIATTGNVVAYIDNKPFVGVACEYTVRAVDGSTLSGYQKTGVSTIVIKAPQLKSPQRQEDGVLVQWNAAAGAQSYRVYRRAPGAAAWTSIGSSDTTQFLDTTAGTEHWEYTVKGVAKLNGATVNGLYNNKGVSI